jgi:dsRNA-specific ribonuclease
VSLCGKVYPEHKNCGINAKADVMEAIVAHVYEEGGEAEFKRIFTPLWTTLARLSYQSVIYDPEILSMTKQGRGKEKRKRTKREMIKVNTGSGKKMNSWDTELISLC